MKNFLFALALLAIAGANHAQSQEFTTIVDRYLDDEDFHAVYVSGKAFSLFHAMDLNIDDPEAEVILDAVSTVEGVYIFATDENTEAHYKEARQFVEQPGMELMLSVRGKENVGNVDLYMRGTDDLLEEIILTVHDENNFAIIGTAGKFDLKKISEIQQMLAESLQKEDNTDTETLTTTATNAVKELSVRVLGNGGAQPEVVITNPEGLSLEGSIHDLNGRAVTQLRANDAANVQWKFPADISDGMYVVQIYHQGNLQTVEQVVVSRIP